MCNHCLPTEHHNQFVRFVKSKNGTTQILIDSEEHGTVVSVTVTTQELIDHLSAPITEE